MPARLRVCEPAVQRAGAASSLNATLPVGVPFPEVIGETVAV
jgi:hypothetical protein